MSKDLLMFVNGKIDRAFAAIEQFKIKLAEDPYHAFDWSLGAFKAAADLRVFGAARKVIERNDDDLADYAKTVHRMLITTAACPTQSTSECSNLIDRYQLAALADLVEYMEACR